MSKVEAKNVINGSHGALWLDNDEIAEVKAFQAKDEFNKEEVKLVGRMNKGYKITSVDGKGSATLHKVNSRMIKKIGRMVRQGKTPTFTLIGKLDDPDALGAERIVFKGVIFDDLTLMNWEVDSLGSVEIPFTYEDYETLELI